jgi:hypothetical protein
MRGLRVWAVVGASVVAAAGLVATAAAVSASGSSSTQERIVGLQTNPTGNGFAVVVGHGPIHAHGKDVVVNGHIDRFVFPNGSIRIRHRNSTGTNQHYDPVTCYGSFHQSGVYRVTGGTGAYSGAHGYGTFSVHGSTFGCSENKPPRIFELILHASGPLHI